jgi:D-arabinono-1,4-lactone oxidase
MLWFPQPGVERVLQFHGKQQRDYNVKKVPYEHALKKPFMNYLGGIAMVAANLSMMSKFIDRNHDLGKFILSVMNPNGQPKTFCDDWYVALPNDDQAKVDEVIRFQFSEIWVDMKDFDELDEKLRKLFKENPTVAGNFCVEIYPAKASPFWMSTSEGHNVVRVDLLWFEYNTVGSFYEYYKNFWDRLLVIPSARLHWGKHLPNLDYQIGGIKMGPDWVKARYPKFGAWKALRSQFDPENIFVTPYWAGMFGI